MTAAFSGQQSMINYRGRGEGAKNAKKMSEWQNSELTKTHKNMTNTILKYSTAPTSTDKPKNQ